MDLKMPLKDTLKNDDFIMLLS